MQEQSNQRFGPYDDWGDETQVGHSDHTQVGQIGRVEPSYGEGPFDRPDDMYSETRQRERFGGLNWGAGFFGWLVAVAVAVLLTSILGAVVAALGRTDILPSESEGEAGTVGVVAAAILVAVLMTAYYTGGYVAGRMSRFDGGRQGAGVWLTGLLFTGVAVGLGLLFGAQYNILDRVNLPTLPIPTETLGLGGVITAVAALLGSLLAAMTGGKVGCRYHRKVDEAAYA